MKKTLSILLSVLMLASTFSISTFNAMAYTKAEAPTVVLGDTFEVEYNSVTTNNYEYYAKFVPTETAFYEFAFDTGVGRIVGEVDVSIVNSRDVEIAYNYMDSEDPEAIKVAAKLTQGVRYYLVIAAEKCGTYKSNVKLQKHKHNIKEETAPAFYVPDLDWIEDGGVYDVCEECINWNTLEYGYMKKKSTIYAPKTFTLSKTTYSYDGNLKKPSVTVKDRKGNVIPKENYKVTYSKNKAVGKATATIEFVGDKYLGGTEKTFKIIPPATSISSFTAKSKGFQVKWSRKTSQVTGYQVQIALNSSFTKGKKTYTITGARTSSKTITGLKGKQKYYVRVRTYRTVDGTKYYSNWSKTKTVTTKK